MCATSLSSKPTEKPFFFFSSNPLLLSFPEILTLSSCGLGPHDETAKNKCPRLGLDPIEAFLRFWTLTLSFFGWAFVYVWTVKNKPLTGM
jgi:hypothetical protein